MPINDNIIRSCTPWGSRPFRFCKALHNVLPISCPACSHSSGQNWTWDFTVLQKSLKFHFASTMTHYCWWNSTQTQKYRTRKTCWGGCSLTEWRMNSWYFRPLLPRSLPRWPLAFKSSLRRTVNLVQDTNTRRPRAKAHDVCIRFYHVEACTLG